jgi:hypothetical protein
MATQCQGAKIACEEKADCMGTQICCGGVFSGGTTCKDNCTMNEQQVCKTGGECDGGTCYTNTCSFNMQTIVVQSCAPLDFMGCTHVP